MEAGQLLDELRSHPTPSPLIYMLAGSQGVGVGVTGVEATRLPVRLPPHHNPAPRFGPQPRLIYTL